MKILYFFYFNISVKKYKKNKQILGKFSLIW